VKIISIYVSSAVHYCVVDFCRWNVGDWQPCSAACGEGQQQRIVTCERALANGNYDTVDTDMCDFHTKPIAVQDCHAETQCHQWETGPWSQVTAKLHYIHQTSASQAFT